MNNNNSVKVLYISHVQEYGGAEVVLLNLLRKNTMWDSVVMLPDGSFSKLLKEDDIVVIHSEYLKPLERRHHVFWLFHFIVQFILASHEITKVARSLKVDIIHSNHLASLPYCILPALLLRKKLVWHMHDIKECGSFDGIALYIMSHFVDKIIAVSDAVVQGLVNCHINKLLIIRCWNGINKETDIIDRGKPDDRYFKKNSKKINVAQIGTIAYVKGQHIFIDAVNILQDIERTRYKADYYIVGAAPSLKDDYIGEIDRQIDRLNLRDSVTLSGKLSAMRTVYENIDVLVFPSLVKEAFGMVLIEAMAMGCIVIAARVGGVKEIIEDGVTGLLFERANVVELAEKLRMVIAGEVDIYSMITKAKKSIESKFSLDEQKENLMAIYSELKINENVN